MFRIEIAELADGDLDNIVSYIAERLSSPRAASDFLDAVDSCYTILKENPLIYEFCRDPRLRQEGYRRAVVKNYIMVYKVDETERRVNIYRFFHGTQDYEKLI